MYWLLTCFFLWLLRYVHPYCNMGQNHLLNYEPFWKIQLFYSGYWAAAVSLCSPFKTPSPLAIKERKSFPGHSSVLQHYSQEEKKVPLLLSSLYSILAKLFWTYFLVESS